MTKFRVYSHTLDGAIKLACASYKSALTNLKNGNIKKFRIRYLRSKKDSQVIDIEKTYIKKNTIFPQYIINDLKNTLNIEYSNISKDCKIHYNRNKNVFTLLVPEDIDQKKKTRQKEHISIDPGLRTFLTCISENQIIEIGSNLDTEFNNIHKRIEKYDELPNKKVRKRYQSLLRERLKNKVKDMHYKIIDFLQKYKNIFIGKLSTKSIISNKSSILSKERKQLAQDISYYSFLQRLKYKCKIYNNNIVITEEHFTTKSCSKCSNIKDIGKLKIYECKKCNLKLDRDVNSARNMLMKNIK
jgi:transposase